ncbi:MAG TPA: thiopurine S-methyltransferase [Gammaproteobacteria bacterium]|nr:thiopurine S-methyltransferase [Gammaproteobacteria bacterium]
MNHDYWLQRWQAGNTPWHLDAVMPLLEQHWPALDLPRDTRVLVPLCGRSLDMAWLAAQGHRVLGVELSPLAIAQFFDSQGLAPKTHEAADGLHHVTDDIEIIQGDIFGLDDATLAGCGAVYDRAAIIALPEPTRTRYANEVYARLPTSSRGLMITFEYPQAQMDGPPFSVEADEIHRLFENHWSINLVERRDVLASLPLFRERGLTALHTAVYQLKRHS